MSVAVPSDRLPVRVLVTGKEGFTGRHVATELERAGYRVHGLSTRHGARVNLLDADAVGDAVALIQPQAVIHLAAVSFVAADDVESMYRTNIVGTRNLLRALQRLPVPPSTIVLASSAAVYGDAGAAVGRVGEAAALNPVSDYGVSKLAMEYMARTHDAHMPVVVARPFNYTGLGQNPRFLVPKIVDHFRRRARVIELGNTDVWREFMDVRAIAWAYRRLLETSGHGATFNLCSGATHSLREVLAEMARIAGYAIEVRVNPAFVRTNEIRRVQGDPARMIQRIGALPGYTLADTLRWMYHG